MRLFELRYQHCSAVNLSSEEKLQGLLKFTGGYVTGNLLETGQMGKVECY